MISKVYYIIVAFSIIITLVACELFTEGYGDKVDLSEPVVTVDSPVNGKYVSGKFTLKGTATDDTSVKEVTVSFVNKVTSETVTLNAIVNDVNWHLDINSSNDSMFKDGEIEFTVTVKDSADKTNTKLRMVYIDNTIPTVLVSSPSEQDMEIVNGILIIRGDVADLKLSKVDVFIVSVNDPAKRYGGPADGTSSWKYELNTVTLGLGVSTVESYYLEVTAYDAAGNSNSYFYFNDDLGSVKASLNVTSVTIEHLANSGNRSLFTGIQRNSSNRLIMNIDQNANIPKIIMPDWDTSVSTNYKAFSSDVFLSGRITDDDGLGSVVLSVYNPADTSNPIRQGTASPSGSRSYNLEVPLESVTWDGYIMTSGLSTVPLNEGLYYFTLNATDIEGSGSVSLKYNANFGIDKTNPEVKILLPVAGSSFNNNFVISGTATDKVNIASVVLYINNADKTDPKTVTVKSDNSWEYSVPVSTLAGDIDIEVLATDGSGKTDSDTISLYVDGTNPVVNGSDIIIPSSVNGTITISGKATDNKLNRVGYRVGDEAGTAVIDGSNWSFTIDTTQFYPTPIAPINMYLQVKAYDDSGNVSPDLISPFNVLTVNEASDKPVITFKTPDESSSNSSFSGTVSFWAEILDDDGVDKDSIVLTVKNTDTNQFLTVNYADFVTENLSPVTFRYTPVIDVDGHFKITMSVKDINGLISEVKTIPFTSDSKGPVVTVDPAFDGVIHKNSNFTISGTATDSMGGVSKLTVSAKFSSVPVINYDVTVRPDGSWSKDIDISSVPDGEEYPLTISINAVDFAQNPSGVITRNLIIDRKDPVEKPLTSIYKDLNGRVLLTGEVSDDNLESVQIKIGSGIFGDVNSGLHLWKYELDTTTLPNGNTTIYVRGIDRAGNNRDTSYILTIDQAKDIPVVTFDSSIDSVSGVPASNNQFSQTSTIGGTVTDDDGVKSGSIVVKFYSGSTLKKEIIATEPFNNGKRVDWSIDLNNITDGKDPLAQGIYTFDVTVADDLAEKIPGSGTVEVSYTSPRINIIIDNGPPNLAETAIGVSTLVYRNDNIPISGTATDGTKVTHVIVSYKKDGGFSIPLLDDTDNNGVWTTLLPISSGNGEYEITIEAKDLSSISTIITRRIQIDTLPPELVVTSPVEGELVDSDSYIIRGQITDNGGKGITEMQYSRDNSTWTDITQTGLNWTVVGIDFSLAIGDEKDQGKRTLSIRATDGLNPEVIKVIPFYYDTEDPVLTETISTSADQIIKDSITLEGTVSDTNKLTSFTLSKDGSTPTHIISPDDIAVGNNNWKYTLEDSGSYHLKFTATDAAGRSTTLEKTILIDKNSPLVDSILISGNYVTSKINITGTASDLAGGSGLKKVYYRIDGSDGDSSDGILSGLTNWNGSIDSLVSEGSYNIYVWAEDYAGNISPERSGVFTVDKSNPVIFVNSYDQFASGDFTITGTIIDTLPLSDTPLIIGDNVNSALSSLAFSNGRKTAAWSVTIKDEGDKLYNFTLVASDAVGRNDEADISVTIDKTPPNIVFISPQSGTTVNDQVTIQGTANDLTSGISKVEYYKNDNAWTELTGQLSWTIDINSNNYSDGVQFRATDGAGNRTEDNANELALGIDQNTDNPVFSYATDWTSAATNTQVIPTETNPVNRVTSGLLKGIVTDDDDVDKASIKIWIGDKDGDLVSDWQVVTNPPSNHGKSVDWSHNLGNLEEGIYQYKIKASDLVTSKAGNITDSIIYPVVTSETGSTFFSVDNGAPRLSITDETDTTLNINNTTQIEGVKIKFVAKDGNGISSTSRVVKLNDSVVLPVGGVYTFPIDISPTNNGTKIIHLEAKDGYGNTSTKTITYTADGIDPVVYLSFDDKVILNGSGKFFTATALDDSGISTVNIYVKNNGTEVPIAITKGPYKWSLNTAFDLTAYDDTLYSEDVTGTVLLGTSEDLPKISAGIPGKYYRVDSSNLYLFNGAEYLPVTKIWGLKVYYTATDNSGRKSPETSNTIYIDETSDLPVLKLDNLTQVPGDNIFYFPGHRISGTVLDDDGVDSDSIKIGIANISDIISNPETDLIWVDFKCGDFTSSASGTDATWSYLIPNSGKGITGDKNIWIKATDINGISHILTQPVKFAIDRESPSTTLFTIEGDKSNIGYSSEDATKTTINAEITDDYGMSTGSISVTFTDKNSVVRSFPMEWDSIPGLVSTFKLSDEDESTIVDLLGNGETIFTLSGNDKFLKTFTATASIMKDTTDPTVSITNHDTSSAKSINEKFSLSGTITETGSGVGSVTILLGKPTSSFEVTPVFSNESWSLTEQDVSGLKNNINSTNIIGSVTLIDTQDKLSDVSKTDIGYYKTTTPSDSYYYYNGAEYLPISEIWEFIAVVKVTDKAGNDPVEKTQTFNINDAMDFPVLQLDNITMDSVAMKNIFPGQLIKGTVTDDDGVNASTIRTQITEPGVAPVDGDWISLSLASNGSPIQWSYEIPGSTTSGGKDLHIKAQDINGKYGDHIRKESFVIDRVSPVISNFTILDSNNKSYINKFSGVNITINADVTDDSLVKSVTISYLKNSVLETIVIDSSDGGSYSETIPVVDLPEGSTRFTLTATDQFGKVTTEQITILKDTILPKVEFISPEILTDINGIINIKGTTSDVNMASIKLYYGDVLKASSLESDSKPFVAGSSLYSWKYKLDTTDVITTGSKTIKIVATDINGNISGISSSSIELHIDQSKDDPIIKEVNSFEYSNSLTTANTYILDHASNNNVLFGLTRVPSPKTLSASNIKVKVNSETESRSPVILSGDGTNYIKWYLDLSDLDDPATTADDSEPAIIICSYVSDPELAELVVNFIALRGENVGFGHVAEYFGANDKLSGYAEDDDRIDASEIKLSINGSNTSLGFGSDSSRVSWSYNFTDEQSGLYLAELTASDDKSYKGIDYGIPVVSSTFQSLIIKDTAFPVINAFLKDGLGNNIEHQGAYVNGSVIAHGSAIDDLSIKKFKITAKKSTGTVELVAIDSSSTDSNLDTADIFDVKNTEFSSTSDNKEWNWEFALERLPDAYEGASISLIYEATDVIGNITTVERSITVDTEKPTINVQYPASGSTVTGAVTIRGTASDVNLESVEMKLGSNGSWTILSGVYSWEKEIYTLDSSILTGATFHPDSNPSDNYDDEYYNYPVLLRAKDKAGNIFEETDYSFKISPNLDKPIVNISSPDNNSKLGGSVRFIGTAEDNTGVSSVSARINVNGDGDYTDQFDLNKDGDFDDKFEKESEWYPVDSFSNNIWKLEINKQGELYKSQTLSSKDFIFIQFKALDDKGTPTEGVSSELKLTLDDTFPVISDFISKDGVNVSGDITLTARITDVSPGTISSMAISFNGGISYEPVVYSNSSEHLISVTKTAADLSLENATGIVNVRLKATDDTEYTSFSTLVLNVDNVLPTGHYTGNINAIGTILSDTTTTEKIVTISGKFSDSGMVSSFNRVEVYFSQNGNIIQPLTGTSESAGTKSINGISVIYPGTANIRNLITIDRQDEFGVLDLDNDGYKENVTLSSGEYVWSTQFDTVNIKIDTPIELNYIVYDDAGNANYYSEIMVMVGFDIDGNDTVDTSELVSYPIGFSALNDNFLYVGVYGGTATGYKIRLLDGANELAVTALGTTEITISTPNTTYPIGQKTLTLEVYKGNTLTVSKDLLINFKGDETASVITINPLNQGSIQVDSNSKPLGHLEMNDPANDDYHDISGSVRFTGMVSDDIRIKNIKVTIGTKEIILAGWVDGIFTATGNGFVITNDTQHWQTGHVVKFYYDWDSSTIDTVAKNGVTVNFESSDFVTDHDGNINSKNSNKYDVVPYITDIQTSLSNAYASNGSVFNRSSMGWYPVRENEEIIISGFNLSIATNSVLIGSSLNGVHITPKDGDSKEIIVDIGSVAISNDLSVITNEVSSINNNNNNNKEQNKEENNINNNLLNDDRKLRIWKFDNVVTNSTIRYPNMDISKGSGDKIGFIYDSGAQFVRMNIDGHDFQIDKSYTQWYDTSFAMDAAGRAYGGSMNGDSGGGSGDQRNGGYANFKYYAWNTSGNPGTNRNSVISAYGSGTKSRAIENAYNGSVFNSNRVLNPKMETFIDGTTQRVFMTYYDSSSNEIKYRAGTVSGNAAKPTFGGALINHNNKNNGSATDFHIVSTGTSVKKPGEFSDVAILKDTTDGLIAVMVWYDATNRSLIYSWNDSPLDTNSTAVAKWQTNATVIDNSFAGWYADVEVDSGNGIHIAYYNSSEGSLKYAYKSNYKAEASTVTIDSFLSTGENLSLCINKEGDNQVPYISYYMGSYTSTSYSVRTAWRTNFSSLSNGVEADKYTGSWEVMTIPTSNTPKNYNIGIGIKSNTPVIGYATDVSLETATIK